VHLVVSSYFVEILQFALIIYYFNLKLIVNFHSHKKSFKYHYALKEKKNYNLGGGVKGYDLFV
jgi:hypothetical protein